MAPHPGRPRRPRHRPDRIGEDPRGVPVGPRRPDHRAPLLPHPWDGPACPLRVAPEGTRCRRPAQPAPPPGPDRRAAPRAGGGRNTGAHRCALGRHPRQRARPAAAHTPRHSHHHPRVPLPDADLQGAGHPHRRAHRHRRRGPRGGLHQTRFAPGAEPGTSGRPARAARATHRPVRHGPPARGGRPLPRRHPPGRHRRPRRPHPHGRPRRGARGGHVGHRGHPHDARPRPLRPRRGRDRPGWFPPRAGGGRGGGGRDPEHLGTPRGLRPGAGPACPVDHRLRQLAGTRREAHGPPQRVVVPVGRGGTRALRPRRRGCRGCGGSGGGARTDCPRPPRVGVQGAARTGRAGSEGG